MEARGGPRSWHRQMRSEDGSAGGDLPIPTRMHGTGGGQSPGKERQGPGGRGGEEAPILDARVAKQRTPSNMPATLASRPRTERLTDPAAACKQYVGLTSMPTANRPDTGGETTYWYWSGVSFPPTLISECPPPPSPPAP